MRGETPFLSRASLSLFLSCGAVVQVIQRNSKVGPTLRSLARKRAPLANVSRAAEKRGQRCARAPTKKGKREKEAERKGKSASRRRGGHRASDGCTPRKRGKKSETSARARAYISLGHVRERNVSRRQEVRERGRERKRDDVARFHLLFETKKQARENRMSRKRRRADFPSSVVA